MLKTIHGTRFDGTENITQALESGAVVYLPDLHFGLQDGEQALLSEAILPEKAKNISYEPRIGQLKAYVPALPHHNALKNLLQRYADFSEQLLHSVTPHYRQALCRARTSYRPVEIEGRVAPSFRKDDTRLHVDAFPASPNQGRQLLRVFCNIHPEAKPRVWRTGEDFSNVVDHFKDSLKVPAAWHGPVLRALHITRGLRTPYDALMLQLHDAMKADQHYQQLVAQQRLELTGTWLVFTDQVSHAAMAGQYCLEQTFMLPIDARQNPATSPLKVLEKAMGRPLV
jgi:hypothetical protein